ncbi:MAG: glycosyltransferase family 39 protein, partial [Candidatus Deferrimicrobiaceae bacterium]
MRRDAGSPRGRFPSVPAPVLAILLFVLSLSAGLSFGNSYPLPAVENDASEYLSLARNVAAGDGFSYDGTTPAVYRPPLFSLLLGGWFRITGTSSVQSAVLFQSFVHALGVVASFLLFLEILTSPWWSAGAAVFIALNPLLVTRVVFVLQEPTLVLFTTLAVWLSVRMLQAPSAGRAALAGAAWGLCTLGKVVTWFAPFLLLAMRLLPSRIRWVWRSREAAALLCCFLGVLAPWTVRNLVHFGRLIPVNDQGTGMLAWNVQQAEIPGEPPGAVVFEEIRRKMPRPEDRQAAYREYVWNHLRYFLVDRVIRNALHFASPARDWWWSRGRYGAGEARPWYWTLHDYAFRTLFLFLVLGTVRWAAGRAGMPFGFLLLFYWAYWIEHSLVLGTPRFGLAVYPLL